MRGLFRGCLDLLARLLIRSGSALGHLLLDHAHEAFIGRPEGLADADGVLDDAGDGGVPVVTLVVDEHAIAPDHQIVGIAARDGRDDAALFS